MVLDNGTITEEGNHEQLMKKEGLYRNMYMKQMLAEELGA